ncbi:hypothetical protein [Paraflavitalea pollutisoli]|uniref:hypothetical protein n=1 Tax=Paraflavitalea pollutisoli TaxID=3034143 RepID=UPI0023EBCEEB|nr:hypothetical protein [Paraflavitalea sp. H1-2-19X]
MKTSYPGALVLIGQPGAYIALQKDAVFIAALLSLPLREPTERIPETHVVFPADALQTYLPRIALQALVVVAEEVQPEPGQPHQLALF